MIRTVAFLVSVLFIVCMSGCRVAENGSSVNSNSDDANLGADNSLTPPPKRQQSYLGCWNGMGGGRLKITKTRIYDLGSREQSAYKEIAGVQKTLDGMQTGEEYLLEAQNKFPKSFLAKFVRLSYLSDGTVGFVTYDSFDDYVNDKLTGQGLFEMVPCK